MSGTLNGMNTVSESSQQESEMGTSTMPQFSAISTNSLIKASPQAIKDWLMLSLEDSRASHTVQPGSSLEKTTQRTDGLQQEKSFARYDQSSACWKTCLGLFPSDTSEKFSGTWPKWGSMRNGELFQQQQPVQTMYARGSGYLPPQASASSHHLLFVIAATLESVVERLALNLILIRVAIQHSHKRLRRSLIHDDGILGADLVNLKIY